MPEPFAAGEVQGYYLLYGELTSASTVVCHQSIYALDVTEHEDNALKTCTTPSAVQ